MNTNETMIEKVVEEIIDELRNYKGFRRWWDDWDNQEQIKSDIGNKAINETIQCLVEKSANADLVFSGGNEEYESNTTKWLKEQLTDKEVER